MKIKKKTFFLGGGGVGSERVGGGGVGLGGQGGCEQRSKVFVNIQKKLTGGGVGGPIRGLGGGGGVARFGVHVGG